MKRLLFPLIVLLCFLRPAAGADDGKQENNLYKNLETFANVLTLIQE